MKQAFCIFLLAFIFISPAHAALISDGDFAGWSIFHLVTADPTWPGTPPNTSTGTGQRTATGGNPGAYLWFSHTFTSGDTSWIGAIKTDSSYDPAEYGGIAHLAITANVESNNGSSAWQLVIEQAGQRYYSYPFGVTVAGGWQGVSASNLTATNFDTNPWAGWSGVAPDGYHPDFGPAAAPLRFGFMFGNKVSGAVATLSNTFGLDNFSLTITPTVFVRIPGVGGFNSLQSAYDSASPSCTIQAQAVDLPDFPFTLDLSNIILLAGGYDGSYTANNGYTTLHGVLTLVNGSLTVENLIISSYVPPPTAPDGVNAVAGNSQVTVSWNTVSGASSYNLYYSASTGVSKLNGTKITGVTSPYPKTSLSNGTPYYFVVTAVNGNVESAESARVSATPKITYPYNGNCGNSLLQGTWYESTGTAYTHFPAQIQFVNIDTMSGYFYGNPAGTLGYGFQVEPVMCGSIDVYDGLYNPVISYGYTVGTCELILTNWGKEHHYCRGGIGNCSSCTQ